MTTRNYALATLFALGLAVSAMRSRAADPDSVYWNNKDWDIALFKSIQALVQHPDDVAFNSLASSSVKVQFTYASGSLVDPEIVTSSGSPELDAALLKQLSTMQLPKATGPQAEAPHAFAMELTVPALYASFIQGIHQAVSASNIYPQRAIKEGSQGAVSVSFFYQDGKVSDARVAHTSGDPVLDKAGVSAINRAALPAAPAGLAGKKLYLELGVCYSFQNSPVCGRTIDTIEVVNTP